jgi:uncharacterized protein (DUF2062 family)
VHAIPLDRRPGSVRARLRAAFAADYPPPLVGASFAVGLFLVALPNLGISLVLVAGVAYLFDWADPLALSAAAVVLNPLVKAGVYVASFAVGTALLGPVPGVFEGDVDLAAGPAVVVRVVVGNVLVAVALAVAGFLVALYGVRAVRR